MVKGITTKITHQQYNDIFSYFKMMDECFSKRNWSRKYFPNLRFVALMLINHLKINLAFEIPLAITPYKIEELKRLFYDIWEYIQG